MSTNASRSSIRPELATESNQPPNADAIVSDSPAGSCADQEEMMDATILQISTGEVVQSELAYSLEGDVGIFAWALPLCIMQGQWLTHSAGSHDVNTEPCNEVRDPAMQEDQTTKDGNTGVDCGSRFSIENSWTFAGRSFPSLAFSCFGDGSLLSAQFETRQSLILASERGISNSSPDVPHGC